MNDKKWDKHLHNSFMSKTWIWSVKEVQGLNIKVGEDIFCQIWINLD